MPAGPVMPPLPVMRVRAQGSAPRASRAGRPDAAAPSFARRATPSTARRLVAARGTGRPCRRGTAHRVGSVETPEPVAGRRRACPAAP